MTSDMIHHHFERGCKWGDADGDDKGERCASKVETENVSMGQKGSQLPDIQVVELDRRQAITLKAVEVETHGEAEELTGS